MFTYLLELRHILAFVGICGVGSPRFVGTGGELLKSIWDGLLNSIKDEFVLGRHWGDTGENRAKGNFVTVFSGCVFFFFFFGYSRVSRSNL